MYEDVTYERILKRMLDRVPKSIDKREGSVIYDAVAPAAVELMQMYIELDGVMNETFADTASREYLIRRAKERGIKPKEATKAIMKGEFNIDVPIGSKFTGGNLFFTAVEKIEANMYKMECSTYGRDGNRYFGTLIPVDYIDGLTKAEITELLIPGEDEEDTEVLRKRYLNSFSSHAFGGNVADYIEKTNSIAGVGGVKVYPVWNGGGSVKLVIISSDYTKPSDELIDMVQQEIDPTKDGEGKGIAPIGHVVSVFGVNEDVINIDTNISYQAGYDYEKCKENIEEVVDEYLNSLNKNWAESENIVVRVSQIESRMLDIDGIIDVYDTKINDVAGNYVVGSDSIVVVGDIFVQSD